MWRNPQTGVVVIEPEFCTACGACQEACPFDVVIFDEHAHVYRKCDLCRHRDGGPLCAEVCPEQAIAVRRLSSGGG
jgi:Fe-S-cluster-containing dehydrogenase component